MKKIVLPVILSFLFLHVGAVTKRALVIGIDSYGLARSTPAEFRSRLQNDNSGLKDLDGAVNDARAIISLITSRFGFEQNNIDTLFNQAATHDQIIASLEKLAAGTKQGDIVFIYYAGHGSQVKNSLSYDGKGKDQTIVPADMYDIRNKELSRIFNEIQENGGQLTIIFDSCHSGAIARGNQLPTDGKTRYMPPPSDAFDARDSSRYPSVEDNGALVFSAAQREQFANESSENNIAHGAFTLALLRAVNSSSCNESAERIFQRVQAAITFYTTKTQDPIMAGNTARRKAGLFGEPVNEMSSQSFVPVKKIDEGNIFLRGGYELNIYPGSRFVKTGGKDTIEVTEVNGIGSSIAHVTGKTSIDNIKPGDLFRMTNFVHPDVPTLCVWYPASKFKRGDLEKTIVPVINLFKTKYFVRVPDPTRTPATFVIQYDGTHWTVNGGAVSKPVILAALTDAELKKNIPKGSSVFLQLPPVAGMDVWLRKMIGKNSDNSAIEIVNDPRKANYIIAGRSTDAGTEYCLLRPNVVITDKNAETTMPVRTNWFSLKMGDSLISDSLATYAVRLGKIRSWLTLTSADDPFPYTLYLKSGGKLKASGDTLFGGDRIELYLVRDSSVIKPDFFSKRYVYVFLMDSSGQMKLMYPAASQGSEGNTILWDGALTKKMVKLQYRPWSVSAPYGYDTYFLVTSEVPLSTDIFETEGVLTRGPEDGNNPLNSMLKNYGARTRSGSPPVTTEWSIDRVTIKSAAKK